MDGSEMYIHAILSRLSARHLLAGHRAQHVLPQAYLRNAAGPSHRYHSTDSRWTFHGAVRTVGMRSDKPRRRLSHCFEICLFARFQAILHLRNRHNLQANGNAVLDLLRHHVLRGHSVRQERPRALQPNARDEGGLVAAYSGRSLHRLCVGLRFVGQVYQGELALIDLSIIH